MPEYKNKKFNEDDFDDLKKIIKELGDLYYTFLISNPDGPEKEEYNAAVKFLCYLANYILSKGDEYKKPIIAQLLYDNFIISKIFVYLEILKYQKWENLDDKRDISGIVYENLFTPISSEKPLFYHQYKAFKEFNKSKKMMLSAPTSFGKTHIAFDIIKANPTFKKIIFVLPTNALIQETNKNLRAYGFGEDYLIIRTIKDYDSVKENQNNKKYIFIFTPEKTIELLNKNKNLAIDLLMMDEIHNIGFKKDISSKKESADSKKENNVRKYFFSEVLYNISVCKKTDHIYLIGPVIDGFKSSGEIINSLYIEDFDIVQKNEKRLKTTKTKNKKEVISGVISEAYERQEKTIVYCPMRGDTLKVGLVFIENFNKEVQLEEKILELIKHIETFISKDWELLKLLKKGVAFHNALMPSYIKDEILELFKEQFKNNGIHSLFCTNTITEGINTNAKNVIFYQTFFKTGKSPIDRITFNNVKGRAGRSRNHFVGNVYTFEDYKDNEDYTIEMEHTKNIPAKEVILQMQDSDLKEGAKKEKKNIEEELNKLNFPYSVIRENIFLNYEKQINLIKHLSDLEEEDLLNINETFGLLKNRIAPDGVRPYEQFRKIFTIINDIFFPANFPGNRNNIVKKINSQKTATLFYTFIWNRSSPEEIIPKLILILSEDIFFEDREIDEQEIKRRNKKCKEFRRLTWSEIKEHGPYLEAYNKKGEKVRKYMYSKKYTNREVIEKTFLFINAMEYDIPRHLIAFNKIYNQIIKNKKLDNVIDLIDLEEERDNLEHLETESHRILLEDMNVPNIFIKKIERFFKHCQNTIEIRNTYKKKRQEIKNTLDNFEFRNVDRYLDFSSNDASE